MKRAAIAARNRRRPRRLLALAAIFAITLPALSQTRPYIGYAFPAGGQRGTTFQVKLGGQGLDDVSDVLVTGQGVSARVVEYYRRLNPQEMQLLGEQLRDLRKATSAVASASLPKAAVGELIARIEKRQREYVQTPACSSLSALVFAEVSLAPDAEPGVRELRLVTPRGVSNPLVFHVGQVTEHTRKPMLTATLQVLGKEAAALRKRPPEEAGAGLTLPCTVNGQIASGEVNRYRFTARRGQRLVFATHARQLIPFIADAVPGWFQPVLRVHDSAGREVAYADDYRFRPDPVLCFDIPQDGEYTLSVQDALYRGREDFIYRVTAGELPFVTSVFPLGAKAGESVTPKLTGWNLGDATLTPPAEDVPPGRHLLAASRKEICNPIPFALDTLSEKSEREPNNSTATAQAVSLPLIINGRIDKPGDADLFRFSGRSNDLVVAAVEARQLDSPLDSMLRLTDDTGAVLAFSDDRESLATGLNTHHADSWLMATLPRDGDYFVHLHDTARQGGPEHGYRLRLSPPRPDFALRVVPSSISLRTGGSASVTVYADRRDGLTNSIYLWLTNAPAGFTSAPVKIPRGENSARLTIAGPRRPTERPVALTLVGRATVGTKEIIHEAVPAEDRMQAFLWRQLAPAAEFQALVFDPNHEPPRRPLPKRAPPAPPSVIAVTATNAPGGTNTVATPKPKFTKGQIERRVRELARLYYEGLLTDPFYHEKMDELETMQ
jgi:hypothetical protein